MLLTLACYILTLYLVVGTSVITFVPGYLVAKDQTFDTRNFDLTSKKSQIVNYFKQENYYFIRTTLRRTYLRTDRLGGDREAFRIKQNIYLFASCHPNFEIIQKNTKTTCVSVIKNRGSCDSGCGCRQYRCIVQSTCVEKIQITTLLFYYKGNLEGISLNC